MINKWIRTIILALYADDEQRLFLYISYENEEVQYGNINRKNKTDDSYKGANLNWK